MASGRLRRNKSLGGYLTSLEQTATNLNTRQNYLTTGLASQSVTESSLAEELTIFNRSIQTENYVEGYSGWRISGNGNAEFGSVVVRGDINAYSGTIGYWNISTPAVSRVIGPHTLLGTFIESSATGSTDEGTTSGTYVGLYKSYSPEELVVTSKNRASNVATLTAENHEYIVGDYVTVELEDDTTFNNGSVPVLLTAVTNDTFSYDNVGTNVSESAATGTAQLYNPDVAGLYLRDYGKREFDYGYFSSAGVAYVSAEDMNIIENPSFEYISSSNVITSSSTSWTAGSGLTLTLDNFTDLNGAAINTHTPSYSAPNVSITTATAHNIQPDEYVVISGVAPSAYNGTWRALAGTTGTTLVVNVGSNPGAITSAGTVDGVRTYDYESKYGARVTWTSSGLSTYFEGKLDYAAGSDYTIFASGRVLYFGGTIHTYYVPAYFAKSSVARYNLTGTFTSASSNTTAITYTGTGLNFAAGQWLTVTGFTGANASTFNIAKGQIYSANSTTVVVLAAGTAKTSAGTGSASVGLFEATTSTTHSFAADDTVFFDFKFGTDDGFGDVATYFAPRELATGQTTSYSFKVLSYPAPTSTLFYVSADDIYANLAGTYLYQAKVNLDASSRSQAFYRAYQPALDISQIQLKYSNSNTTPLTNVVSVATKAQWDAGTNKYYLTTSDAFMEGYLDPDLGIPAMTKSDLIIIDADLLDANYKIQDPTGYAAQSDITFQIPGWLYKHDGLGNVTSTKITASTAIGYVLDNLYLATNNKAYYGNNLGTNRWYDNTANNTAQASVEGTKTWIDINLSTQDAQLNYLSRVGFRGTNFSKLLYSNPSISAITQETSFLIDYPESESLTVSSGEYQYLQNTTTYRKLQSYSQLQVGDKKTSFESVAIGNDILVSNGATSIDSYALVGGYYSSTTLESRVVIAADEFRYYGDYDPFIEENSSLYTIKANSTNVSIVADLDASSVSTSYIRLSNTDALDLLDGGTQAFQIGGDAEANLRIDTNTVQALDTGAAADLYLNSQGANVIAPRVRLTSTTDVTLVSTAHAFQIGDDSATNMRIDPNEIQAVNNGAASTLNLNPNGGNVALSNAAGSVVSSAIYNSGISGTTRDVYITDSAGGYVLGYLTSNRDSKQDIVLADLDVDLILDIEPKFFKYKADVEKLGNSAPTVLGFIAEDLVDSGLEKIVYKNGETGQLEGISYSHYVVVLQAIVRDQASRITNLESRISALEAN